MLIQKTRWQVEADVVVIGYGAAGAVAAITAHDAGAEVVILEKQPSENHISSSFMSGGVIIAAAIRKTMPRIDHFHHRSFNVAVGWATCCPS